MKPPVTELIGLAQLLEGCSVAYLTFNETFINFYNPDKFTLTFQTAKGSFDLQIPKLFSVRDVYYNSIFNLINQLISRDMILVCWDIKQLISFFKNKNYGENKIKWKILDLKLIQSFLGLELKKPKTFLEAIACCEKADNNLLRIHEKIHTPLSLSVIPALETHLVANDFGQRPDESVSYYEIEGQINGRLSSRSPAANFINPHAIAKANRHFLRPINPNKIWLSFDYSHMEASVLQWLSQDELLKELIDSNQDLYKQIYKIIYEKECEAPDEDRAYIKSVFLPIAYGMGAYRLSEEHNLTKNEAHWLIARFKHCFPTLFSWLYSLEEQAQSGSVQDYFKRTRSFEPGDIFIARNFSIQAPAALICLHKLIELHDKVPEVDIVFSIHDAYVIEVDNDSRLHEYSKSIVKILQAPEEMYPGLKLKTKIDSWGQDN